MNEQAALVTELEESLRAAETRATTAANDAATLRKNARELEEADRARRSRLAELEGKLLRLEHEKKAVAQAAAGNEELERKLQAAETERETLRAERDRLLGRVGELETAPPAAATAMTGGAAAGRVSWPRSWRNRGRVAQGDADTGLAGGGAGLSARGGHGGEHPAAPLRRRRQRRGSRRASRTRSPIPAARAAAARRARRLPLARRIAVGVGGLDLAR